jgi:hypothetical protein
VCVTLPPEELAPTPGERGRASQDALGLLEATLVAWDEFLSAIGDVDLAAPSRKPGRTAARVLVVLGAWPESRGLQRMRSDALAGITTAEPLDDLEQRVIAAHADDDRETIWGALLRARSDIAEWASSPHLEEEALLPVGGPLGVVPLGTLVAASAYQCAVAARDLVPAGVQPPSDLLAHGLAALVDTVGAVAAQQPADLSLTAETPQVRIGTGVRGEDWRTTVVTVAIGPTLVCDAGLLLDIASGRASAPAAYARGDLRAHDLPGLLVVAQALASAPGLPGTEGLRTALQGYAASAAAARAVGDALGSAWRRLRRD